MAVWWPRVLVIGDEERYVAQALAFADGSLTIPGSGIIHPATPLAAMSDFPPGTSVLQVPFVFFGGWRAAPAASLLCLLVAALITMKWLRDAGREPAFALFVPGFFGAAFFGRVAMSDVPSAAVVASALWMLWRAEEGRERSSGSSNRTAWAFGAATVAGASLLFRETNALLLLPLFVHALWTGTANRAALIAGGVVGVATRLAVAALVFGAPFYVRDSGYGFSPGSLRHTVVPYAFTLLVLFPLGGVLPLFYRGERAAALKTAVLSYVLVYLLYEYDSISENGPVKGLVLSTRFIVPASPLLAFMAADVFPRWYRGFGAGARQTARVATRIAAAAMVAGALMVHALASVQEAQPAAIARSISSHTRADRPVITNNKATLKYLSPAYAPRHIILRSAADSAVLRQFQQQYPVLTVVLLDRRDSEMFREDAAENEQFLQRLRRHCEIAAVHDTVPAEWARLRVLEARNCS